MIRKTILLTEEQSNWLDSTSINFSKFVRNKIEEERSKEKSQS